MQNFSDSTESMDLPLAWGTGSSFGQIASHEQAQTLINTCLDCGIRRFDTGASYAMGNSEKLLGSCLHQLGINRNSLILSTKIGSIPSQGFWRKASKDYGASATEKLLLRSLENLKTDYIDIVFFHSLPQNKENIADALSVLNRFKASGQIREVGVAAHSIEELEWIKRNSTLFSVLMTHFNPLAAVETGSCLEELKRLGMFIYGSAPFASGMLFKKRDLFDAKRPFNSTFKILRNVHRLGKMSLDKRLLAKKVKCEVNSGNLNLLNYSISKEFVDVTITGTLSASRIKTYSSKAMIFAGR